MLPSRAPPAADWEYRIERAPALDDTTHDWLNALGADGWELTATWPDGRHFVFKRRCRASRQQSA
jgi:hypothetical protein